MPQFPYEINPDDSKNGGNPSAANGKSTDQAATKPKVKRAPVQFKKAESKGPVTRVRVKGKSRSKSSKTNSPFKDLGVLEDAESLIKFRDEFGKPVALTILAAGIVCLIYWMSTMSNDSTGTVDKIDAMIAQANELEGSESGMPPKELYQKKLDIAEQLLKFTDAPNALERGAQLKLKTLTQQVTENIHRGASDPETISALESTAREFINSRDKSIASYAKIGLTLIRAKNYLEKPNIQFFPEILDQFTLVSSFAATDLPSAENLMRLAQTFQKEGLNEEATDLFRAINLKCSTSDNQNIANIGLQARQLFSPTSAVLQDLKSLVKTGQEIEFDPIRKQVQQHLNPESLSATTFESVLDFVEFLNRNNAIAVSKKLLDEITNSVYELEVGLERDAIKQRFDNIKKRVDQFGQSFSFEGLYSVEGRPISRASLQRRQKLIVFWSPENSKSVQLLEEISEQHKKFETMKIQVVAITNVDENDTEQVAKMSNSTRGIEFLTVINGNTLSRAFRSRFPVPGLPYWVILDDNDRIRGLHLPINLLK